MALPSRTLQGLARLEERGIRLGRERMSPLLERLGRPQEGLPAVLIAGTNGKGSTAAFLAAMASTAGYRTGLFTSPELEEVEEQILIGDTPIEGSSFASAFDRVTAALERSPALDTTRFEALTAVALLEMAERRVDLAILEAGLGGERDATNAVEPVLSVVTNVTSDHAEWLGTEAEAIREKAGILRPGVPAVVGVEEASTLFAALHQHAEAIGAPLHSRDQCSRVEAIQRFQLGGLGGQRIWLQAEGELHVLETRLPGRHQVDNLGLALAAARVLSRLGYERLSFRNIAKGARACRWPGRLELVELEDRKRMLLDAAHNPAGIAILREFLAELESGWTLLFGTLADKAVESMLPRLAEDARRVVLTRTPGLRGADPGDLIRHVSRKRTADVEPDLDRALAAVTREPGLTVVCGSIRLVGEVRKRLRRIWGRPDPPGGILDPPA